MKRLSVLISVLLLFQTAALAAQQSPERLRELEKKVEELEKRLDALSVSADPQIRAAVEELKRQIDALTREIETLKSGVPEKAAPSGPAAVYGVGPAASRVYRLERGVSVGGYGEFLYQNFNDHAQNGTSADKTNQIDLLRAVLYFGYKFDERFLFNSEVEFEHAVTASDKRGETEVEFAYLDWRGSRVAAARAGLVLVPMGLVNELHEPPVFLGARRPEVEEVIIPSTWRELGLGFYGDAAGLSYRLYLINGLNARGFTAEGIAEGRQEGSQAVAKDFAVTGRLDWTPVAGGLIGASFFSGNSAQGARTSSGESFGGRTTLWDVHIDWRWRGLQARALFVDSQISDAALINEANGFAGEDSVGSRQRGWYVQAGYDVLSLARGARASLVPFARWERHDTQRRVPAGFARNPENNVSLLTLGAVFKPIEQIAVKADWERRRNAAKTGVSQWNIALGYLF